MEIQSKKITPVICDEPWFSYLKQGIKPVEGRKNSPKYQHLDAGDYIQFINEKNEQFLALITEIRTYKSLEDYLYDVTLEKALPGVHSFHEALKIYLQWSSPEEIDKYGFLGIFVTSLHSLDKNHISIREEP